MILTDTRAAAPLRARLALDPRGLALLRAGLGLLLAFDAMLRLCSAGALYADTGLLPRAIAVKLLDPAQWSLYLANGSLVFALLMSGLQLLAALMLTIGWRSRLAGALLWVMVVSAFARHPAVVGAADLLALSLLTLGLFLPWNARWSVDHALRTDRIDTTLDAPGSWPELALRAHVALMPAWLALATLDSPAGLAGLLASDHGRALGHWLAAGLPGALGMVEVALRAVAFLVIPLALWPLRGPSWASRVAALLLVLLALTGLVLLHAGALPLLGLLAAGLLIDAAAWDRFAGAASQPDLRIHYDREVAGAGSLSLLLGEFLCLPRTLIGPAQDSPRAARLLESGPVLVVIDRDEQAHLDAAGIAVLLRRSPLLAPIRLLIGSALGSSVGAALLALRRAGVRLRRCVVDRVAPAWCAPRSATAVALTVFAGLVLVQSTAVGLLPRAVGTVVGAPMQVLGLDRSWLDALPTIDGAQHWITVIGERIDGGEVDASDPRLPTADYAARTPPWLGHAHARAYERALARPASDGPRLALAQHLCGLHAKTLARVRVTLMVREPGAKIAEQRVLLRHECRVAAE